MRKLFRANSHNKVLNIPRFLSFTRVTVTHWERLWMSAHFSADLISSLGANTVQCSLPRLMESHSAGPLRQANWGSFYLSLHYNMLWSQICQREERTRIHSSRSRVLDSGYAIKRWDFCVCVVSVSVDACFSCYTLYITIYNWYN